MANLAEQAKEMRGATPSEWKREYVKHSRRSNWARAAYFAAVYTDEISRTSVSESVGALSKAAKLSSAAVWRAVRVGRVIARRAGRQDSQPIPSHLLLDPLPQSVVLTGIKMASRLGIDPVDFLIRLEQATPTPTVADIENMGENLGEWSNEAPVAPVLAANPDATYERHALLSSAKMAYEYEWSLVDINGYYRAAQGRSAAVVGSHRNDITQDIPVRLDGMDLPMETAWADMIQVATVDGLDLPRFLVFPDIDGTFEHRPDAAGPMETIYFPVRVGGKVVGFLFIDTGFDKNFLRPLTVDTFRQIREKFATMIAEITEFVISEKAV